MGMQRACVESMFVCAPRLRDLEGRGFCMHCFFFRCSDQGQRGQGCMCVASLVVTFLLFLYPVDGFRDY